MNTRFFYIKLIFSIVAILIFGSKAQSQKADVFIQLGHNGFQTSVAFSPDGRYMLSGSSDNTMKLWEVSTGREIRTFRGHSDQVSSVAFTPDGRYALSGSWDSTLKLWELSTGRELRTFEGHNDMVISMAISPDGQYALSGSGNMKLWEISTGRELRTFEGHSHSVSSVAFSPDGRYALSGSFGGTLKLWEISTGRELRTFEGHTFRRWRMERREISTGRELRTFEGHSSVVNSVAFSPDGQFALSGSDDGTMKLWEISTGRELRTFEGHSNPIYSVTFSPDGQYALMGGQSTFIFWDLSTGLEIHNFNPRRDWMFTLFAMAFSPDGKYAQTAGLFISLALWDLSTGREIRTFTGISDLSRLKAFSPDGRYMLSRGADDSSHNTMKLHEIGSGREVRALEGHSDVVRSAAFSPDGQYALSGSWDKTMKLWEISTGRELRTFEGHSDRVTSVAFSPDGRYALSGSWDGTMKLWEISTGRELRTFDGHSSSVYSVAFSPDGRYVLSAGSWDKTMKLWEISTGRELRTFEGHSDRVTSVAFSPDGRYALSGSWDGTMKLWEISTGRELRTFDGHSSSVYSMAFSPDGRYALSGSWDGTMKLWEISTGRELRTFEGHSGPVENVAFSSDGQYVLSSGWDRSTRIWNPNSGEELAQIVTSPEEWVIITPEGYFDASENGAQFISVSIGNEVFDMDNFFDTYYRPDIVRAKLAGEDISKLIDSDIRNVTVLPPTVRFTSPQSGTSTNQQTITLTTEITDRGSGIGEIRLMHNGSNISGDLRAFRMVAGDGQTITRTFEVPLLHGENHFRLSAFNTNRIESNPAELIVTYEGAARESNLYIISVGVDEYQNRRYNLNYGRSDAEAFAALFEQEGGRIYNNVHITRIFDGDATRATIQAAFTNVQQSAKAEDTFKFFYAGHGVVNQPENPTERPDFFLALHDVTQMYGQEQMLRERGISATELNEWVTNISARRKMIVFDACQAGGAIDAFAFRGAAEERAIQQLARSSGVAIIASAESEQFATEFAQLGHGVFTYALLNGLRGEALMGTTGSITVQQLIAYINQTVPDLTLQYRGQMQYPVSFSRGMDFPLMVRE